MYFLANHNRINSNRYLYAVFVTLQRYGFSSKLQLMLIP